MTKRHPEEEKLLRDLAHERPNWKVQAKFIDDASNTDIGENDIAIFTIDAGNLDHARDSARTCNEAVARKPGLIVVFGINGLADDPREVDEIPEGRATLIALYTNLTKAAFHRFGVEQQAMMLVAAGLGQRLPGGQLMVPPSLVKDPAKT